MKFNEELSLPTWGKCMICPFCGETHTHFSKSKFIKGFDSCQAWDGRGDSIEVNMSCENGCKWIMRIGHHKGHNYFKNIKI